MRGKGSRLTSRIGRGGTGRTIFAIAVVVVALSVVPSPAAESATGNGSLTTTFAGGNSFAGNTFDLDPKAPLVVKGFDVHLTAGTDTTMTIYWKEGTAAGFESTPTAWTLLGSDVVTPAGTGVPTHVDVGGLSILPGKTYGIYVDVESYPSASLTYTTGGPTLFSNADLDLTTYVGKGNPAFSGETFSFRTWNGTVHYSTCGAVVTGNIVLARNIGPCPGHGLIAGGNVNLNLNGFVIRGQGVGNGVLVPPGVDADGVVVRNGSIRGFRNGVRARASTVRLIDLALQRNDARGAVIIADRGFLARVTAAGNDSGGIFARVADGRLDIRSSRAVNNGGIGMRAVADVLVARNNLVRDSARHGLSGAATTRGVYTGNRVVRNGFHGLVNSAVPATIDGNVALSNTRLGIVAPDRPAVRGSNTASGNNSGRVLQCRPERLC